MIEYNEMFLPLYKEFRQNSIHIINDATKINYNDLFERNNVPLFIDYIQIDLEVINGTTLLTLEKLDKEIFDIYKFATVTFEHDIYDGDKFNTRLDSRKIFLNRGYILVFPDVRNGQHAFEDWYIHPNLVNINYINKIKRNESLDYHDIMDILNQNN